MGINNNQRATSLIVMQNKDVYTVYETEADRLIENWQYHADKKIYLASDAKTGDELYIVVAHISTVVVKQ